MSHDRRLGNRIPMELLMNEYMQDRPYRALSVNISESGLYVNKVVGSLARRSRVVGLEFELPGTSEVIWARGEVCYDTIDDCFHGQGIRFTGMPKVHQRLIRDYCIEKRRAQLAGLLDRIRRTARA
jgi:hypothetical protein